VVIIVYLLLCDNAILEQRLVYPSEHPLQTHAMPEKSHLTMASIATRTSYLCTYHRDVLPMIHNSTRAETHHWESMASCQLRCTVCLQ
jgi:hypothetical protein